MKLTSFGLYRFSLPLSRPLTLGEATLRRREGLLLRLSGDDGSEGWGETAPLPGFSKESLDEAASQLRRLAGAMVGHEVTNDWIDRNGAYSRELECMAPAPSARFGFDSA